MWQLPKQISTIIMVVLLVIYDTVGPCGCTACTVFCVRLDFIDWWCDGELQSGFFVQARCHCYGASAMMRMLWALQPLWPQWFVALQNVLLNVSFFQNEAFFQSLPSCCRTPWPPYFRAICNLMSPRKPTRLNVHPFNILGKTYHFAEWVLTSS